MIEVEKIDGSNKNFRIKGGKLSDTMIAPFYLVAQPGKGFKKIKVENINPKLFETIDEHVSAYVHDNIEPPKEIAVPIYNLAEEYIKEGNLTIRAGDYVSIMDYIRK